MERRGHRLNRRRRPLTVDALTPLVPSHPKRMLVRSSVKARSPASLARLTLASPRRVANTTVPPLASAAIAPSLLHLNNPSARSFSLSSCNRKPFAMAPAADPASYPQPPVLPPSWSSFTPELVASSVDQALADSTAFLDQLVAIPPADRTFESVVRPLALQSAEATARSSRPSSSSTSTPTRPCVTPRSTPTRRSTTGGSRP